MAQHAKPCPDRAHAPAPSDPEWALQGPRGPVEERCPFLGLAGNPSKCFPMPCDANVCHVDPLNRRRYADLPLTCQTDFCLSGQHRACRYWRNAFAPTLGVGRFLLSQLLLAGSACLRSLRA